MRIFKAYCHFVFTLLSFTSCYSTNTSNLLYFPSQENIYGNRMLIDSENLSIPSNIEVLQSHIVVLDNNDQTFLTLIDKSNNKIIDKFGNLGHGPGELLHPGHLLKLDDNKIGVFDLSNMAVFAFDIDSLINSSTYIPNRKVNFKESLFFRVINIDQNKFFGYGISQNSMYALLDYEGNLVNYMFDFPVDNDHKSTPSQFKSMAYQGNFAKSKNKFAFACSRSQFIEFFEVRKDEVLKIKEWHISLPKYKSENVVKGSARVILNPDNVTGYVDVAASDKHFFALFSGQKFKEVREKTFSARRIHVFNLNGEPIIELILDKYVTNLAFDEESNTLYCISNIPEPALFKFELPAF